MAFLRVAGCPIRCRYCDTPHSYTAQPEFRLQLGSTTRGEANPATAARAAELVRASEAASPFGSAAPRLLSITGGEPLLYPEFVRDVGRVLRPAGWRVHLETAALDAQAFATCAAEIDHLSADYKLPETLPRGEHRQQHVAVIAAAAPHPCTIDVKVVLTADCGEPSFATALEDLAPWCARLLLVLQPVTPFGSVREPLPPQRLAAAVAMARAAGFEVRVLPQAHKSLGVE